MPSTTPDRSLTTSTNPNAPAAALRLLRARDNPFSSLVARPGFDQGFHETHVPGILADERGQLEAAIARYRVPAYNRAADLLETRAVVVRGARGAGKTHLLRALAYSEGLAPLIVRPSAFDPAVPFEELVLADFVRALCEPDEIHGSRFIDDLATWLGRRLLRQALVALGPADRVYALAPSRWQRFRWLGGRAEAHSKRFDGLAKALGSGSQPVADLLRAHDVSVET